MKLARGCVVVVELDPAMGHEQRGIRPRVVEVIRRSAAIRVFLSGLRRADYRHTRDWTALPQTLAGKQRTR